MNKRSNKKPFLRYLRASLGFVLIGLAVVLFLLQKVIPKVIPKKDSRHVILVSIDTCRADHLGCYGNQRKITPNIDHFAKDATVFENVVTPMPLTLPAHSSMFTGTIPPYHGVHNNFNNRLGNSYVTIAEILKDKHFATGAVIGSFVLDAKTGINQGFDTYIDDYDPVKKDGHIIGRRAEETSRLACAWLQQHKDEIAFMFIHYYDPHFPYDPPEPFASTFAGDFYSGEIAYTDKYIGQVIEKLKNLGLYDSSLIIITADHGEMLGEHGEEEHGFFIYESAIKVPLIVKVPGGPKGKRVSDIVSLIDITPTICGSLGISIPASVQGRNILSRDFSEWSTKNKDRYIYCESTTAMKYHSNSLLGVVTGQWKYIQTTRPELYNLNIDKQEKNNLVEKYPKQVHLMREHLKLILDEQSYKGELDNIAKLDSKSVSTLESLGYVAGNVTQQNYDFDQSKTDPKDLIEVYKQHTKLITLISDEQYKKAKPICAALLAAEPENAALYCRMGKIDFALGDVDEAIACFSKALKIANAGSSQVIINRSLIHQDLAQAFSRQNNHKKAAEHYTKVLEFEPDNPAAYYNLGNAFWKQNNLDKAVKYYTKSLALKQDFAEAHYNLGNVLYEQGKFEKAMSHFDRTIALKPDWQNARKNLMLAKTRKNIASWNILLQGKPNQPDIHNNLGRAYILLGEFGKAVYHLNKAIEFKPDWPDVLNSLAWLKATYKNKPFYDPNKAVQLASRACELTDYKIPYMLDTLSIAYAATGKNNEAIETAEKALSLARSAGQHKLSEQIEKRLQLYKNDKP